MLLFQLFFHQIHQLLDYKLFIHENFKIYLLGKDLKLIYVIAPLMYLVILELII